MTSLTRAETQILLNQFNPVCFLHKNETFGPSSVDFYLQNVNYYLKTPGAEPEVSVLIPKPLTVLDLWNQAVAENFVVTRNRYLRADQEQIDYVRRGFPNVQNPSVNDAPCYGIVRDDGSVWSLIFIYFYCNNRGYSIGGAFVGQHEADIEHVTIEVEKSNNVVRRIFYSTHGADDGVWIYDWPTTANGQIIVFSAIGNHGNYNKSGLFRRFAGLANDIIESGTQWNPNVIATLTRDNSEFEGAVDGWIYHVGSWGPDAVSTVFKQSWFVAEGDGRGFVGIKPVDYGFIIYVLLLILLILIIVIMYVYI